MGNRFVVFNWSAEFNDNRGGYSVIIPMAISCQTEDLAMTFQRMLKRCRQVSDVRLQATRGKKVKMYNGGVADKYISIHRPTFEFDGTITNPDNVDLSGAEILSVFLQMGRYFVLWT